MTIFATFDFNSKEYYRALRAMMRYNRAARLLLPTLGVGMPALAIWFWVIRDWDRLTVAGAILNGAPWIVVSAFYLAIPWLTATVLARRALRDEPNVRGEQTRIVTSAGLEVRGANYVQQFNWPDIVRTVETPEFFLFFYNRRAAQYLPKRALNGNDTSALRELLDAHAPGKHRLAPA
jgi:YcxB-like protein